MTNRYFLRNPVPTLTQTVADGLKEEADRKHKPQVKIEYEQPYYLITFKGVRYHSDPTVKTDMLYRLIETLRLTGKAPEGLTMCRPYVSVPFEARNRQHA